LLEAWQLAQVDRPPEPPRDESREPDAEDVRDAGPPADGRELPQRRETEGLLRPAEDGGDHVARDGSALAERVLSRGGMEAAGAAIGHQRAVAERPHPWPVRHFEELVHEDAPTTLRNRESSHERIRRRAGGPDEGVGLDRPPVGELDDVVLHTSDRRAGADLDAALCE